MGRVFDATRAELIDMDEPEFQRMLERFPVVRKRTHARVEWNSIYDNDDAASKTRTVVEGLGPQHTAIDASEPLSSALNKFLQGYFLSVEASQIQREFEKAQLDFLAGLSLEDIDDLCAQFVEGDKE